MGARTARLEDCLPVAAVASDAVIARDGALTIGWELFPCEEHTLTQEQYDLMTSLLAASMRSLPPWTMIHRQDIYCRRTYRSPEGKSFLGKCYARHFDGRGYLQHRQFIWFTFSPCRKGRQGVMKGAFGGAAGGIRYKSPDLGIFTEEFERFGSVCAEVVASMTSSGCCMARRITSEDLEGQEGGEDGIIQDYLNWFSEERGVCDIISRDGSVLERGRKVMLSYSFSQTDDYPSEVSNTRKDRALSSQDCGVILSGSSPIGSMLNVEHMVNIYYLIPEQQHALRDLDRRKKNMTAMSQGSAENVVNAEGITEFINMIHADSTMAVYTHMNVIAWGERRHELAISGAVGAALTSMGMTSKANTVDMAQLFFAGCPGGELEIGEDNLMIAELEQAVCMGINESYTRDFPGGSLQICDRRRLVPVITDTLQAAYDANLIENYNAFILGPSGSGKSFFTNWYVRNCYDAGQHIFIIDKGDSYEGLCAVVREESGGCDGVYYSWSEEHPFAFAPFEGCRQWADGQGLGMSFLMSLIKIIWTPERGWDSVSEAVLYKMILDFVESLPEAGEDPVFDDFLDFINRKVLPYISGRKGFLKYKMAEAVITPEIFDIESLCVALESYSLSGRFGFLLNERHPADLFASRFVVFEVDAISQIDQTLYALCTFCIINAFEKKMRSDSDAFRLMFIEEAWQAIASEATADYLRSLWKTARKYHTSATVVTQQVSDLKSSHIIRDAIINNSPVKILLDQKSNASSLGDIVSMMGLSPAEHAQVLSVGRKLADDASYREVFISLGGKRSRVYALEVSPEEALVYESDKVRKRPLMQAARSSGSIIWAVGELVKEKKGGKR